GWRRTAGAPAAPGVLPSRPSSRRGRPPRQGAGGGGAVRAHRGDRGVPRRRRPRGPQLPSPVGPQRDDVRPARAPVRVLHLRDALVLQPGLRRRGRTGRRPRPGAGPPRRCRPDAGAAPGRSARTRPLQRSGEAVPGPRHPRRARRRRPRPRGPGGAHRRRRDRSSARPRRHDPGRDQPGGRRAVAVVRAWGSARLATV
ncbi:MAG: DNA-3-methyladenine glycosylase II, partial [uncultured Acidimicrobiales bacterium]